VKFRFFQHVAISIFLSASAMAADDVSADIDPYWISLHEPAVIADLKLNDDQTKRFDALMDRLDLQFFPLRNKSTQVGQKALQQLTTEAHKGLSEILTSEQSQRVQQIQLWRMGTSSLLHEDVVKRMRYTESQRKKLAEIMKETQVAVAALTKQANSTDTQASIEKSFLQLKTNEQTKALKQLTSEQQASWQESLGRTFDLTKLGQVRYRAPELARTNDWLNSKPLRLSDLRGKVVVLHFYACGCSNCINNYPTYRDWHNHFQGKNVVMIGIHTPETSQEREPTFVRQKALQEQLAFPILIDGKSENWNAWGNSIWPCVYLIDKRGYLRTFWAGELKWQGANGDQIMRDRIETLLAETP
jgi:peroxiredoxin